MRLNDTHLILIILYATFFVSLGTMVVFFIMFEVWFKVPLPKGPLEALLGYR